MKKSFFRGGQLGQQTCFFSVVVVFPYVKYTGILNVVKKAEGCSHQNLMYSSQIITAKNSVLIYKEIFLRLD